MQGQSAAILFISNKHFFTRVIFIYTIVSLNQQKSYLDSVFPCVMIMDFSQLKQVEDIQYVSIINWYIQFQRNEDVLMSTLLQYLHRWLVSWWSKADLN